MSIEDYNDDGVTPLNDEEARGLIPDLTTRGQLNEWEQANIVRAALWAETGNRQSVLSVDFAVSLHRRMFDQTWEWAGTYRRSHKSIGMDWLQVPVTLRELMTDTQYRIDHSIHSADEVGVRFHHHLVQIHPFPNGNGRHARLMTDLLLDMLGAQRFSWGRSKLRQDDDARRNYIAALRSADNGVFYPLIDFVRS
jgi:Fic-DOC domain mobile mystery protein B